MALRLNANDTIELTDGKGHIFKAEIVNADRHKTEFRILNTTPAPQRDYSIHLVVAPTKNSDRMEWMVEKCTEVGIDEISFIQCKTSERKSINLERLEKITVSAMKQSRRAWLPSLNPMVPINQFLEESSGLEKFIAHQEEENSKHLKTSAKPGAQYVVMIGPEGDFVKDEMKLAQKNGFQKVSLGVHRLRTETAGLFTVMILNFLNQK